MSLRAQVFRGGTYLALRQLASLGIGTVGVFLLTGLIGPSAYGRYVGSLAIVLFLTMVGRLGVDVYLIRRPEPPDQQLLGLAFATMAVSGAVLAGATLLLAPVLLEHVMDPSFIGPLRGLVVVLVLSLLLAPPLALLDRALNYRAVALLELGNAIVFYGVALPFALDGRGVWAPVLGQIAAQVFMVAGSVAFARPRVAVPRSLEGLRDMLGYGIGFTASSWLHELRTLVNPLVVGSALGPAAVGYVSLAVRVTEMAGFARAAGYRLALSAFARVASDVERLRRAVAEAMVLQTLGVGPFLVVVALVAPWFFEAALGESWSPVAEVYPFVALAYLVGAPFGIERSLLYVVGRNRAALLYSAVYVGLLTGGAVLFVAALDDPKGYGLAEVIALAAVGVLHVAASRTVALDYVEIGAWLAAFAPPLFAVFVPLPLVPVLFVPLVAVLLRPARRRTIRAYVGDLRATASPS